MFARDKDQHPAKVRKFPWKRNEISSWIEGRGNLLATADPQRFHITFDEELIVAGPLEYLAKKSLYLIEARVT